MTTPGYPAPAGTPWPGMALGQALDRIWQLVRAHFRLYLQLALIPAGAVLAAIVIVIGIVILAILPHLHSKPAGLADFSSYLSSLLIVLPACVFLYLAVFVVYAIYAPAAQYAVVRTHRGFAVTVREAWTASWRRGERHIWLMFLLAVILAGPIYVVLAIFGGLFLLFALSAAHSNPAAPLAFVAFMPLFSLFNLGAQIYMVFMFLRYGLSIPACIHEDLPAVAALSRSAALTRNSKGRIFLVFLVVYAVTVAVILGSELVVGLVASIGVIAATLFHAIFHSALVLFLLLPIGGLVLIAVLVAVFSLPYVGYSTALGVIYCDQKQRIDGPDANPNPIPDPPPAAEPA